MKNTLILFTVFFTTSTFAQKAQLTVIDPDVDSSSLSQEFEVNAPIKQKTFLPDRQERDELLKDVSAIDKWDELQKDIFFLDLQTKDLDALVKKYSDLTSKELKKLKARIKK